MKEFFGRKTAEREELRAEHGNFLSDFESLRKWEAEGMPSFEEKAEKEPYSFKQQ